MLRQDFSYSHLDQGRKNAVAHSRYATKNLECAERDYAATYQCVVHNFKCNIMAKLVCLHYYKFLRSAKTHRIFSPLV